jgi:SAM-dependent methyltransferase
MKFYQMLAKNYDEIFPMGEMVLKTVQEITPDGGAILDVGCATGRYMERLGELGYDTHGVEYSPELVDYDKNVIIGDMHDMPFDGQFDTVMCTGNTLVHTADYSSMTQVLAQFCKALKPNGKALIQILNYDFIMAERLPKLPDIKTDNLLFERFYDYEGEHINFRGRLTVGGETDESVVRLFPAMSDELICASKNAGFAKAELFGGYDKSKLRKIKGLPLVAILHKD